MNTPKHSPLPWACRPWPHDEWGFVRDPNGRLVATARVSSVPFDDYDAHREAGTDPFGPNAELIVRAVNYHAELLDQCKAFLSHLWSDHTGTEGKDFSGGRIAELEGLIARAEGRKK